jgi:N4-(beta-N-acetylglucosaminyl)-L-asparaginase
MSRWRDWREKRGEWGDWVAPEDGKFEERGDSHGTINVLAIDARGGIAGATSTSGLSFKSPGRVGDSPIIGAGLYVDNDVGAAGATGRGEEVIRTCGSEYVVRLMGGGKSPREACVAACRRIIDVAGGIGSVREDRINVKFVAVSREGEVGCAIILGASDNPPQMSYCDATGYHVVEGTILAEKETSPES